MEQKTSDSRLGPVEETPWPKKLAARVVSPTSPPRIYGYDAEGDLAQSYSFGEIVLLALTGELPRRAAARGFEVALAFLAPASVAEAPTHVALLARLCGARDSGVVGAGAVALAEEARTFVEAGKPMLTWLAAPSGNPPPSALGPDGEGRAAVDRLRRAVEKARLQVPGLEHDLTRDAALLALLHACGLRQAMQLETACVVAKLPCAMAEASYISGGAYKGYPMDLPPFTYEPPP